MFGNYWRCDEIFIKSADTSDTRALYEHFCNSEETTERSYDRLDFPPTLRGVEEWIQGRYKADSGDNHIFIIYENKGDFVGYIDVWDADRRMGTFRFGIKVVEDKSGKGYATKALVKILSFYFDELGYQKSDVYIYSFNERSIGFHRKIGFIEEGRLRRQYYSTGRYYDALCYGMTAEEYREKYGNKRI